LPSVKSTKKQQFPRVKAKRIKRAKSGSAATPATATCGEEVRWNKEVESDWRAHIPQRLHHRPRTRMTYYKIGCIHIFRQRYLVTCARGRVRRSNASVRCTGRQAGRQEERKERRQAGRQAGRHISLSKLPNGFHPTCPQLPKRATDSMSSKLGAWTDATILLRFGLDGCCSPLHAFSHRKLQPGHSSSGTESCCSSCRAAHLHQHRLIQPKTVRCDE
jgi:hypothetical protein